MHSVPSSKPSAINAVIHGQRLIINLMQLLRTCCDNKIAWRGIKLHGSWDHAVFMSLDHFCLQTLTAYRRWRIHRPIVILPVILVQVFGSSEYYVILQIVSKTFKRFSESCQRYSEMWFIGVIVIRFPWAWKLILLTRADYFVHCKVHWVAVHCSAICEYLWSCEIPTNWNTFLLNFGHFWHKSD